MERDLFTPSLFGKDYQSIIPGRPDLAVADAYEPAAAWRTASHYAPYPSFTAVLPPGHRVRARHSLSRTDGMKHLLCTS